MGRFLNADAFASTGQGLLGNNMFAYCMNNPVDHADIYGCAPDWSNTVAIKDGGFGGGVIGYGIPLLPDLINDSSEITENIYNTVSSIYRRYTRSIKSSIEGLFPGNYPVTHHIVPHGSYLGRNIHVVNKLKQAQRIMIEAGVDPKTDLINQVVVSSYYHLSLHTNDYILMVTAPIIALGEDATAEEIYAVLICLRIIIAANDQHAYGY